MASDACNSGKVKSNGAAVKPSKTVKAGDQYQIKTEHKKWMIEVISLLHNRVKYEEAIRHYLDLSPKEMTENHQAAAFVFNTGKRKSKQGRPTKKEKRKLDDWFESE